MNANYKTKEYYSINSKDYISTTKDVDMSEHYNRFIHFLKKIYIGYAVWHMES